MSLEEYKYGITFPGVIERTVGKSEPARSEPLRAKENAPKILFIVLETSDLYSLGAMAALLKHPI